MCTGIFLGTGKQKIPAVANFIGYYCVGLTMSVVLTFVAKLRILGNWPWLHRMIQVLISEASCVHDGLTCLFRCRFLAGFAHLCCSAVHLLHHRHLQARLDQNDGGGMLLANRSTGIPQGLETFWYSSQNRVNFYSISFSGKSGKFLLKCLFGESIRTLSVEILFMLVCRL